MPANERQRTKVCKLQIKTCREYIPWHGNNKFGNKTYEILGGKKFLFDIIIEVYNLQPSSELLGEKSQILIQSVFLFPTYIILKYYG